MPILIPGHTPGSLAFIFPVYDRGKRHMVGMEGAFPLLGAANLPVPQLKNVIATTDHFAEYAKKMHVDVSITDHNVWDNFDAKTAKLKDRKPGDPNPFVVGEASYQRLLKIMDECAEAQIARNSKD